MSLLERGLQIPTVRTIVKLATTLVCILGLTAGLKAPIEPKKR